MKLRGWIVPGPSAKVRICSASGRLIVLTIDTGFTGELALPMKAMRRLGFAGPVGEDPCVLGDGSVTSFPVFRGRIRWFGKFRVVQALASPSDEGLMGMDLLWGARLIVEPKRGRVRIEEA